MFGTMGFSELIIILVIVLIIFGAGRLPQIGEGVGKALKGFRREVTEVPQASSSQAPQETEPPQALQTPANIAATRPQTVGSLPAMARPNTPRALGPEQTPGTTASLLYNTNPQPPQISALPPNQASASASNQVLSMEERAAAPPPRTHASYPPLPAGSQAKVTPKRPSAIINKNAVARVQAQQAALKAKQAQSVAGVSPDDLQHLGEGLGEVVRTYRQAVTEVRNSVDPQISTIQAEMAAAKNEIQQSIEAAKELPQVQEDPQKSA
ncbi:MAG: twin-arginine translocase TatA/TatE family subunit [Nitrospira sp.]|nr:twin-arginine translocase TatA/TatE family subunit [Nitrospira sp.]